MSSPAASACASRSASTGHVLQRNGNRRVKTVGVKVQYPRRQRDRQSAIVDHDGKLDVAPRLPSCEDSVRTGPVGCNSKVAPRVVRTAGGGVGAFALVAGRIAQARPKATSAATAADCWRAAGLCRVRACGHRVVRWRLHRAPTAARVDDRPNHRLPAGGRGVPRLRSLECRLGLHYPTENETLAVAVERTESEALCEAHESLRACPGLPSSLLARRQAGEEPLMTAERKSLLSRRTREAKAAPGRLESRGTRLERAKPPRAMAASFRSS